jgi:hypothetical protein
MDSIYDQFSRLHNVSRQVCDSLKEFEIQCEIQNSYLIVTNCNRVSDGDILVSDMYLDESSIRRILKAHGFKKDVRIYVTPNGKRLGAIWPSLASIYTIKLHLGDNEHSDVKMAQAAGIKAEHTTIHAMNPTEEFFVRAGQTQFALDLREFRHRNPYPVTTNDYQLYNDQAEFNIATLVLISNTLVDIMKKESRTRLFLFTRDGCLLRHILPMLYPEIECLELHSSRHVQANPNPKTSLLFDIYGTFRTGRPLYKELFGEYPRVHLIGYDTYWFNGSNFHEGLTFSSFKCLEGLNYDVVGPLIRLDNGQFVRSPVVCYEREDAMIYRRTVIDFCSFFKGKPFPKEPTLTKIFLEMIKIPNTHIRYVYNKVQAALNKRAIMWDHPSLTKLANVFELHRGSSAGCGHRYTEYYDVLFRPWYNKPCSILELGIGRYAEGTPSLDMWRAYMDVQTKVYGYDKDSHLKKYHNPSENIHIYVGSQRDEGQIEQCCVNTYDIIIDDGDHDSKGQQTMLKTLWKSLNPGGYYCIESLHWQPYQDTMKKTADLLLDWKTDISMAFCSDIESIELLPSKSTRWPSEKIQGALGVIRKRVPPSA